MAKFSTLLNLRLKQKESRPKMTALAERTSNGGLSSFSGVFRVTPLNDKDKNTLEDILLNFREDDEKDVSIDLENLASITSEVRAITNQAVMLHGERIQKARMILKDYKEGAFTAWLIATYGNRQTPYNFLQYYEFYTSMPSELKGKIDEMPRQVVYTLASRDGDPEKKKELVMNFQGQPKQELLTIIRGLFPLGRDDKRLPNLCNQAVNLCKKAKDLFSHPLFEPSERQKKQLYDLLSQLDLILDKK